MAKRFTGKNRQTAKFLGIPPEKFDDPGFCLGCGESNCVCDLPDDELDDDSDHDDEDSRIENALEDCGQVRDGGCLNAGTEYCDFVCPYRDIKLFDDDDAKPEETHG